MKNTPYQLITQSLIANLTDKALSVPRLRTNYNFHQLSDQVQRFLNVAARDTYIRPHKHQNPDKTETFIILDGSIQFFLFDDVGNITHSVLISSESGTLGIDIPPRVWHCFVVLSKSAALFEIKEGPYDPSIDKHFAEFAPEEYSPQAASYLQQLKAHIDQSTEINPELS